MGDGDSGGAPSLSEPMVFKQIFPLTRSAYNYGHMPYISGARETEKVGEEDGKRIGW